VVKFTKISPAFSPSFSRGQNADKIYKVNFIKISPEVRPSKIRAFVNQRQTPGCNFWDEIKGLTNQSPRFRILCCLTSHKAKFARKANFTMYFTVGLDEYARSFSSTFCCKVFTRSTTGECARWQTLVQANKQHTKFANEMQIQFVVVVVFLSVV